MSNIITKLTCKRCKKTTNTHISVGNSTSDVKWICDNCGNRNIQTFKYPFRVKYLNQSLEEE